MGEILFYLWAPIYALLMLIICLAAQIIWLPFGIVLKICGAKVKVVYPLIWWRYVIIFRLMQIYPRFLSRMTGAGE